MAEIFGSIASLGVVFQTIKEGANALREAKNLELYQRMMDVYGNVMDLVEKNRELVGENRKLEEQLKVTGELQFDSAKNHYWRLHEGRQDGPFCSVCWDVEKTLVRMHQSDTYGVPYFYCPSCQLKRHRSG